LVSAAFLPAARRFLVSAAFAPARRRLPVRAALWAGVSGIFIFLFCNVYWKLKLYLFFNVIQSS
jgi:hypothetical protein